MSKENKHPTGERYDLLTAAVRMLLAERNYGDCDAVPEDSEGDAQDALGLAARAYVRALDLVPRDFRPPGWALDEVDDLRVQLANVTGEVEWLRAWNERNQKVIEIWVDYHIHGHPLPEDVRKRIVAAMDGVPVGEVRD